MKTDIHQNRCEILVEQPLRSSRSVGMFDSIVFPGPARRNPTEAGPTTCAVPAAFLNTTQQISVSVGKTMQKTYIIYDILATDLEEINVGITDPKKNYFFLEFLFYLWNKKLILLDFSHLNVQISNFW